jgi:hypothetical protein
VRDRAAIPSPRGLLPLLALAALPARAEETLAVLAVADPPGPETELSEMTHQLRAACRERTGGVQEVPEMRQRLLGQAGSATLAELERAYGGALATYQNGEYESSVRTLHAIVDDLERLPEGPEAFSQWVRAQLRLAHAEETLGHVREEREAMERVLAVEPRHLPDPDLYSPTYRKEFEAARARLAVRPRRKLAVSALGWSATVYVNGRAFGTAPVTALLPPGRYRVGGAAGTLRVPSVWVDLRDDDRSVALDFGLAEALRVSSGPGLALAAAHRPGGIVRAGAWLGADRLLATSIAVEGEVPFLVGSLYDVRRGALQREGRVRMAAGAVPGPHLAALAAFLLTGQQSSVVVVARSAPHPVPLPPPPAGRAPAAGPPTAPAAASRPAPVSAAPLPVALPAGAPSPAGPLAATPPLGTAADAPPPREGWMRPATWASAAAAAGLAGVAAWQGLAARGHARDAGAMLRPDGSLEAGVDPAAYDRARAAATSSRRWAYASLGGAVAFAAAAGVLGWLSWDDRGAPVVRF